MPKRRSKNNIFKEDKSNTSQDDIKPNDIDIKNKGEKEIIFPEKIEDNPKDKQEKQLIEISQEQNSEKDKDLKLSNKEDLKEEEQKEKGN